MTAEDPTTDRAVLREYLLAFADDEHLMGQQHTEWIGVAPFLEEDLAFSSIGQDELGHAVLLYELVCELDGVEPTDAAIDALAFERGATEYRSAAFTEYVTSDWAEALIRHWIYDLVEEERWQLVSTSSHAGLASAAVRAGREELYHRRHAQALMESLINTPARVELERGLAGVWPLVGSLLAPVAGVDGLIGAGIASDRLSSASERITAAVTTMFEDAGIVSLPDVGTSRLERSSNFAPLMRRMREVLDLDPGAVW